MNRHLLSLAVGVTIVAVSLDSASAQPKTGVFAPNGTTGWAVVTPAPKQPPFEIAYYVI